MSATIAVVIPAWNEPESIGSVLAEIPVELRGMVHVVVGDHDDPTAARAAAHGASVVYPKLRGYGAACLAGAQAAMASGASILAFLDGDYSDPPSDLTRIVGPVVDGRSDVCLGIRDYSNHPHALPRHARLGNWTVSLLMRGLIGAPYLRDLPSMKALSCDTLLGLNLQETTYGWTVELLAKSLRSELVITQLPVSYRPRLAGHSKVSGTLRGSVGAGWKLGSCAVRYARWTPGPGAGRPQRT